MELGSVAIKDLLILSQFMTPPESSLHPTRGDDRRALFIAVELVVRSSLRLQG